MPEEPGLRSLQQHGGDPRVLGRRRVHGATLQLGVGRQHQPATRADKAQRDVADLDLEPRVGAVPLLDGRQENVQG